VLIAGSCAAFALTAAQAGTTITVCSSGCNYTTIQAAVNAALAGDTITVASGAYAETVSITKNLTLRGAQAGVAGSSHSGAESTVTGFSVTSADVTIDGFEVNPSASTGAAVTLQGGNPVVENTVIKGYGDEGVSFRNVASFSFQHNLVTTPTLTSPAPPDGPAQDGLFASGTCAGLQLSNNVFDHASSFPGADMALSCDSNASPTIDGNTSTDAATLVTLFNATGGHVTNNSATSDSSLSGSGIYIGGGDATTTVSGNHVHGFFYGVALRNVYSDGPSTGTTITGNDLTGNYGGGISAGSGAVSVGETVQAHSNDLSSNPVGVNNASAGSIDASNNWWGSAVAATVAGKVTGTVTATPYYVDSALTHLSTDVPSTVYVDGSYADGSAGGHSFGWDAFATVQAGVDAVASAGTVHVAAGSYAEDVTIAKALTLDGAQAGNDARTRSGSESTARSLHVTASNVVIDGFTFNNVNPQLSVDTTSGGPALSGVVAKNDVFSGYTDVAVPTYNAGNLLLQNNLFKNASGSAEAIQIKADSLLGGCDGSQVKDSKFVAATTNGAADINFSCTGSSSSGIVVSGNTSTGTTNGSSLVGLSGITGGSITGNTATTDGSTIFVFGAVAGTLSLSGNTFTSTGGNAITVHAHDFTSDLASTGTIDIESNTLSGASHGLSVAAGALGPGAQVKAHGNVVTGGVANASGVAVNATRNWFGSLSGPSASTDVTTTPWCTAANCSTGSDDAYLTALSVSGASLSPAFAGATTSYSVSVANPVTSLSVSQTAATGASAVVHGSTSSLSVGTTSITVVVTSLDGTATKTYTITVTRAGQPSTTTTATPPVNVPASAPAAPGKSGTVTVAVAPVTSTTGGAPTPAPVTVAVNWAPQTFTEPVTVKVTPTTLTSIATLQPGGGSAGGQTVPVGGGFALGSAVVQLNITTDAGAAVTSFAAPMVLHIDAGKTKEVPAYSQDGITWTTIPKLGSPELPEGQRDGYFVNPDGSIDVYTRHATYFALLKDTQAPTAPTLTGRLTAKTLRLNWRGMRDNVRIASYVVLRNGRRVKVTKRTVLVLPRSAGSYVVYAIDTAGNKGKRSKAVTVARTADKHHPFTITR
jgi:hypothetical protein